MKHTLHLTNENVEWVGVGERCLSQQPTSFLYTDLRKTKIPSNLLQTTPTSKGLSSPSCASHKSICPSVTSLSRNANSMMVPRASPIVLASFENKPGETVAAGWGGNQPTPNVDVCHLVSLFVTMNLYGGAHEIRKTMITHETQCLDRFGLSIGEIIPYVLCPELFVMIRVVWWGSPALRLYPSLARVTKKMLESVTMF